MKTLKKFPGNVLLIISVKPVNVKRTKQIIIAAQIIDAFSGDNFFAFFVRRK